MNKTETAQLLLVISNVYQNFEADEVKLRTWHDFLSDYPYDKAEYNLRRHINHSAFPPTIADLKARDDRPVCYEFDENDSIYIKMIEDDNARRREHSNNLRASPSVIDTIGAGVV